jgi:hypothetical protein
MRLIRRRDLEEVSDLETHRTVRRDLNAQAAIR